MTTKLPTIEHSVLDQIHGGEWQADFVTGLAAGFTLDAVLHVGRIYLSNLRSQTPKPRLWRRK